MKIYLFSALLYFSCLHKIVAQNTSNQGNDFLLTYGAQRYGYSFIQRSSQYDAFYNKVEIGREDAVTAIAERQNDFPYDNITFADHFPAKTDDSLNDITESADFKDGSVSIAAQSTPANLLNSVDFDMPKYCISDGSVVFVNKTIYTGTGTLTYLWNFGDFLSPPQNPNTSTQRDGTHAYTDVGIYEVTLTVTSSDGYTATVKKQFTVNGTAKAAFDVINEAKLCSSNNVEFRDKATVTFGDITRIEWYFDAENTTTPNVVDLSPSKRSALAKVYTFKYATFTDVPSKKYVVKMKAFSGSACVNEEVKTITIYANPEVDFELESSCLTGGIAKFKNLSTYAAPDADLGFRWDFGDADATAENPNTSTLKNAEHKYTKAGTYTVTLTVITPFGCEKVITKDVTINGAMPDIEVNVTDANSNCNQQPVAFETKTNIAFGKITKIEWYYDYANNPSQVEVDDSPLATGGTKIYKHQYPTFSFPFSKTFQVRMMVYTDGLCIGIVDKQVTIIATPDIAYSMLREVCSAAAPVQMIAFERNNMPGTGEFSGKGISKTGLFDPAAAGIGLHAIKYTFVATGGCSVEIAQTIMVNESPVVSAGDDVTLNVGAQVKLKAIASGGENLTYKWTPATGLDRDDVLNPTASPTTSTLYTLTVKNSAGCEQSDQVFVKLVRIPEVPSVFTPNGDFINDVWNIKYLEFYQPVTVSIYDRNGSLIFSSKGYQTPFDGTYNGTPLPVGVYYYVINLFGYGKPVTGALTIVR